jgi:hypothetical protein
MSGANGLNAPGNRFVDRSNHSKIPCQFSGHPVAAPPVGITWKCVSAVLGLCLLWLADLTCSDSIAEDSRKTANEEQSKYDKTTGDTRVVLLAISSVHLLTPLMSTNTDTTFIKMSFLTEYLGTNSFAALACGPVDLYANDNESKRYPLISTAVLNVNVAAAADSGLPTMDIKIYNEKKCYIRQVFLQIPDYPSGGQATCLLRAGFYGQLGTFEFDDIPLPYHSTSVKPLNKRTKSY